MPLKLFQPVTDGSLDTTSIVTPTSQSDDKYIFSVTVQYCEHPRQYFPDAVPRLKIVSVKDSDIFEVAEGCQYMDVSLDILDSSWAGRSLLVSHKISYLSRLPIWLWRDFRGGFQGLYLNKTKGGYEIAGGSCSHVILLSKVDIDNSLATRLLRRQQTYAQ